MSVTDATQRPTRKPVATTLIVAAAGWVVSTLAVAGDLPAEPQTPSEWRLAGLRFALASGPFVLALLAMAWSRWRANRGLCWTAFTVAAIAAVSGALLLLSLAIADDTARWNVAVFGMFGRALAYTICFFLAAGMVGLAVPERPALR